jgi:hypothetical protein
MDVFGEFGLKAATVTRAGAQARAPAVRRLPRAPGT